MSHETPFANQVEERPDDGGTVVFDHREVRSFSNGHIRGTHTGFMAATVSVVKCLPMLQEAVAQGSGGLGYE